MSGRKLIKHLGANYVLTQKELGFTVAINKAYELQKETENSVVLNQYENEANFLAHQSTTAKEIFSQTECKIDIFVTGLAPVAA